MVTDKEYPSRVAFHLGSQSLRAFYEFHPASAYERVDQDITLITPSIRDALAVYQNPEEADQLLRMQRDIDDVKSILHTNIETLLQRGEKLESIIERSEDLNSASKQFLWRAKSQNACCYSG